MAMSTDIDTRALRVHGKNTTLKKKLGTVKRKREVKKLKKEYLPKRKRVEARARIDAAHDSSSEEETGPKDEEANSDHDSVEDREKALDTDEDEGTDKVGNAGWADAMSRLLNSRAAAGKSVVMAKGQTDQQVAAKLEMVKAEVVFEVEPNPDGTVTQPTPVPVQKETVERTPKEEANERRMKRFLKKEWDQRGRIKPDITKKDLERQLVKIATKGVVQLFNAVKDRQVKIAQQFSTVGGSEVKRDKVMKSMGKGEFLDAINSKGKSVPLHASKLKSKKKGRSEEGEEAKSTWNILRDDYMMGATMKDWDKQSDSEEEAVPTKSYKSKKANVITKTDASGSSSDEN